MKDVNARKALAIVIEGLARMRRGGDPMTTAEISAAFDLIKDPVVAEPHYREAPSAATITTSESVGVNFGLALFQMQHHGARITRHGWNGKGMWLYYVPGGRYPPQTDVARRHFVDVVPYRPYIAMKTAQGDVVPWGASQSDLLADDWEVLRD